METDESSLEERVAAGDPAACMQLGKRLLRGRGIERNYERALACFDTAARSGNADAFYLMGKCYLKGVGCIKDPGGAVSCLENAARRGHASAALKLGECFERIGAPKNDELAAYWYRKAAARGESRAYDDLLRLARAAGESPRHASR